MQRRMGKLGSDVFTFNSGKQGGRSIRERIPKTQEERSDTDSTTDGQQIFSFQLVVILAIATMAKFKKRAI